MVVEVGLVRQAWVVPVRDKEQHRVSVERALDGALMVLRGTLEYLGNRHLPQPVA